MAKTVEVKMLTLAAGPLGCFQRYSPALRNTYALPVEQAQDFIQRGYAVEVGLGRAAEESAVEAAKVLRVNEERRRSEPLERDSGKQPQRKGVL